jgi:hypothetical protein
MATGLSSAAVLVFELGRAARKERGAAIRDEARRPLGWCFSRDRAPFGARVLTVRDETGDVAWSARVGTRSAYPQVFDRAGAEIGFMRPKVSSTESSRSTLTLCTQCLYLSAEPWFEVARAGPLPSQHRGYRIVDRGGFSLANIVEVDRRSQTWAVTFIESLRDPTRSVVSACAFFFAKGRVPYERIDGRNAE